MKRESRHGGHNILPRGLVRHHEPGHHVHTLHRLRRIPRCIGEVQVAVNPARRLRADGGWIKPRKRVAVIHLGNGRVGIADADGHAVDGVGEVHHRKPRKIGAGGSWVVRQHVHVGLRPSQTQDAPQDAHQPVLNVGQLRVGSGADSVDYHQRVRDVPARREVIGPAIDSVGEAIGRVSGALAQQRVGDGSVGVVDNSDGRALGRRCNVRRCGDGFSGVDCNVASVHVLREMATLRCGEGNAGNTGPSAERAGNQGVGLRVREDRTQVPLVGEVLDRAIRPDHGLAFDPGVVAGARDKGRTSGAAGKRTANHENRTRQNSPAHVHSCPLRAPRMERSSCTTLTVPVSTQLFSAVGLGKGTASRACPERSRRVPFRPWINAGFSP